ncbi:hypothetical protein [Dethiothermospora halolimnae]|uniref:hypothetical protein n=1 Tax=Dethiothermospora halolimnae TaxID=3114390 RepID=UPI003CCBEADB
MKFSKIKVMDDKDNIMFDDNSLHLPIKEEYIIEKSIELFNDPELCVIHRSAVIYNIGNQITKNLSEEMNLDKEESLIQWDQLPTHIKDKLLFDKVPNKIIIQLV